MQNRDSMSDIEILTSEIVSFIQERDWDQFHTPKDTALALSIEASELNEVFLWKNDSEADIDKIREELADVFIYALDLARQYNLDVAEIIRAKVKRNGEKYPVSKCMGTIKKYTEL